MSGTREPKPRRIRRARYPQRCKICGHTWLSFTWGGPKQCPFPGCGNLRWRLGPAYLTENRKAQGWRSLSGIREALRREYVLLGTPLYSGEGVQVEPLGLVVPAGPVGSPNVALEGVQEALGGSGPPEDEESPEEGS